MSPTHSTQDATFPAIDVKYTPEQIRQSIGSQLCDARKRARLTQVQLAKKTGIDQAVISRVERGHANPTLTLLQNLANPLGVRVALVSESSTDDENNDDEN